MRWRVHPNDLCQTDEVRSPMKMQWTIGNSNQLDQIVGMSNVLRKKFYLLLIPITYLQEAKVSDI